VRSHDSVRLDKFWDKVQPIKFEQRGFPWDYTKWAYFNNTLISLVLTFSDKSFIYLVVIKGTLWKTVMWFNFYTQVVRIHHLNCTNIVFVKFTCKSNSIQLEYSSEFLTVIQLITVIQNAYISMRKQNEVCTA